MTENFKILMEAFGKGVFGESYVGAASIDADDIMKLASRQGVKQTVYYALCEKYDVSKYEMNIIGTVAKNIQKTEFIRGIVEKLENAQISCSYLKGMSVARFYNEPDTRISGDTDILIDKKDIKKTAEILRENGFTTETNVGVMYHFEACHPIGGLLEVHFSLYRNQVRDLLFEKKLEYNEEPIEVPFRNYKIKTLGINDGVNYLTAHVVKHFITDGLALRQIMDLLLYMKHYSNEISWKSYNKLWEEMGFLRFINTLKAIGNIYWDFEFQEYDEANVETLLTDIENGGLFGADEAGRKDFLDVFLAQKYKNEDTALKKYMRKNILKKPFNLLFPSVESMEKKGYKKAGKNKFNLIMAYIKRWVDIFLKIVKGDKKSVYTIQKADSDVRKKRIELMKNLEMLDKNEGKR